MLRISLLLLLTVVSLASAQTTQPTTYRFSFTGPQAGQIAITPDMNYTPEAGYGFDLGSKVTRDSGGAITGQDNRPFFFSANLPPGPYQVTGTVGDPRAESTTTIKSETRRLMFEDVHTAPGQTVQKTFLAHLRIPTFGDGNTVRLKPRESTPINFVQWDKDTRVPFMELDWDEKLTLEFSGDHPTVDSIEITPAPEHVTIYLIGDSTMTDQMMEPWCGWGQMFTRWFKPPVLVANYAESGETAASFIGERRWPKLMTEIHAGDFVLMQFGINDRGTPADRFKEYFVQFINDTRQHGATPILVTSQNLWKLDANGKAYNTLVFAGRGGRGATAPTTRAAPVDYPQAMREVAREQNVQLIDLNAMSMPLYEAIGQANFKKSTVDTTHGTDYGSYELAKCVVQAVIDSKLPWARYVTDDWKTFDPAHPDPASDFKLPPDPQLDPARPGTTRPTTR